MLSSLVSHYQMTDCNATSSWLFHHGSPLSAPLLVCSFTVCSLLVEEKGTCRQVGLGSSKPASSALLTY